MQAYAALSFLYLRSERHAAWPVRDLRRVLQPPVDLNQVKVFYQDGIPRSAVTWGLLSEEAERRHVGGSLLEPAQWRSGDRFWVMDILAPYGQGSGAHGIKWLKETLPESVAKVRTLRVGLNKIERIVEFRRRGGKVWGASLIDAARGD